MTNFYLKNDYKFGGFVHTVKCLDLDSRRRGPSSNETLGSRDRDETFEKRVSRYVSRYRAQVVLPWLEVERTSALSTTFSDMISI